MELRLMTSNIWGDYFNNPVEKRAEQFSAVYARYFPDVLGLQEANNSWWNSSLMTDLASDYVCIKADGGEKLNYTPLFYRKDRFEVLECGRYLYHEILDPSKGWTCAVFREKKEGKTFAVFCTHFWWKPELVDEVVRVYNAKDLTRGMKQIQDRYHCPVFFMGDLNCRMPTPVWDHFHAEGWKSSFECTIDFSAFSSWHGDPVKGEDGFFHGKTTAEPKERSLDYIGIPEGVTVRRQQAVAEQDALDASDHSPVLADVSF